DGSHLCRCYVCGGCNFGFLASFNKYSQLQSYCSSSSYTLQKLQSLLLFLSYFVISYFESTCPLCRLPYRWQVLEGDGVTWKDLPDMEDIEKAYCDPGCVNEKTYVDFLTMTCGGSPVRRLSTASSVSKPPHFILTTQWLWYWKDDIGEWLEYGQAGADTPVTSESLESVYQADIDTDVEFNAGDQRYTLYFRGEPQTIEVRRRPRFVSAQEVEELSDCRYKTIPLSKSEEYNMIEMSFKKTMSGSKIHSIKRIQNPSLWRVFQWQKDQMKKRNGGKVVNEQNLFHGTDESLIEAICDQNFDWRVCGAHGTSYGKGSYFAKDASYSDTYVKVNRHKKKTMFVALVLVGEYTRGSSSYVRPPPKRDGKTLYDSCVDRERNPSIYVIFEKHQIYPGYLIEYS
uniref:Poly [ADP-ribose] polymerase n=1 Tax=Labrus bergylta TaxID=56723 RepID=A0A3Q3EWZ7_9LABR